MSGILPACTHIYIVILRKDILAFKLHKHILLVIRIEVCKRSMQFTFKSNEIELRRQF